MGTDYSESLPLLGGLPKHWEVVEFGSILDGGTRNGIYKKKEFHGRGDKIVNMGELFAFSRLFSVPMKRVELSEKEQEKFRLQKGDLLFARRSLVAEGAGKCSLVCEIKEPTTFESSIIRARPNSDRADSLYLFYLFRSPYGTYILDTIRRQVAVAGITGTDLVKLPIPLPPLDEQKEIAHILGTLDDKIELNQQMNRTLEGIARALFKSWFIDFDPVRAKLDGRQPYGMDAETAALFPNSFEDSPLGKIPKGWEIQESQSIFSVKDGTHDSPQVADVGHPLVTSRHLKDGFIDFGNTYLISEEDFQEVNKRSKVDRNDILITMIGTVGNILFVDYKQIDFAIKNVGLFKTSERPELSEYFYFYLRSNEIENYLRIRQSGTTQSYVTLKILRTIPVLLPPLSLVNKFRKRILPCLSKMANNREESTSLTAIRDALLPKLLSGEIRVKDAEQALEAVI